MAEMEPTPRRIQEARESGNVPRSAVFSSAVVCAAIGVVVSATATNVATDLVDATRTWFAHALREPDPIHAVDRAVDMLVSALWPVFAAACVAAFLITFLQVGRVFVRHALSPDAGRIAPDLRRFVQPRQLARVAIGTLIAAGLTAVACAAALGSVHALWTGESLLDQLRDQWAMLVAAFVVMATIDGAIAHVWWKHGLRMTRREVEEERRRAEGDARVRTRQRRAASDE